MGFATYRQRPVLFGHLLITVPAIVIVALTLIFPYYLFSVSPGWPYYLTAALALAWQWYSAALLHWKSGLLKQGFTQPEVDNLAQQGGLALPFASIGLLALHTTAAALCASYFDIWLTGRWYHWILPSIGLSGQQFAPDARVYYLQHLALSNLVPPFIVGYFACHKYGRFALWAWALPTTIMAYKLFTFTDPSASVVIGGHWSRFPYYFGANVLYSPGFDAQRFLEQVTIVAFFYSGIAYSVGAFTKNRGLFRRVVASLHRESTISARDSGLELITEQTNNAQE